MGFIPADKSFLELLREVSKKNNSILIFDEVMSGFRVALGGAQELYNVQPDLTALGKVIGALSMVEASQPYMLIWKALIRN